ncbi:hypothetical protein CBR_g6318 [Chara braunii]|uniref:CCHC-type domain-containing protein n=1 Tax=Chara braunii TaxID=69332 RepID=A0A388KJH9_CHABU|nr:hypothetical protein CBR_g6318 [Chara braunii]|eukprot:GBG70187.1 hypothetical protein CBR_g6318 [Chara braunii]
MTNIETKMGATTYRGKPGSPYSLRWDRRNTDPLWSMEDRNPRTLADNRVRERDEDGGRRRDEEIDRDRRGDRYRRMDTFSRGGRQEQYPRSPRYDRNVEGYRSPDNFNRRDRDDSRGRWESDRDRRDGYRSGYERAEQGGGRRDDSREQYDRGGYPASSGYPKSPNYPKSYGPSNQDVTPATGLGPRGVEHRPPTPRNSCIYCKGENHVKRDCPDLRRVIGEGLVVLDERKYVKWADDLGDVSMFPSMKENVEARRVRPRKGKDVAKS